MGTRSHPSIRTSSTHIKHQLLFLQFGSVTPASTMASVTRVNNSALRAALRTPAFTGRATGFNAVRCYSAKTQTLKERFAEILPEKVEQIKALRKEHGSKVVDKVTLDQVYGGARGIKCLVWEGSVLDSEEGIRFRGKTIPECQELLPKALAARSPFLRVSSGSSSPARSLLSSRSATCPPSGPPAPTSPSSLRSSSTTARPTSTPWPSSPSP